VIDCPLDAVAAIKACLDAQMVAGSLRYGMNVSETALMTCLVTSPTGGLHVHFVDGGDGGYTSAAKTMKATP
jgi:spermidine synthase